MKTVENLTVEVTYRVQLGNINMPDEVYDELISASLNEVGIGDSQQGTMNAYCWLNDNISEDDAIDWFAEIIDID
jgi:hypothetical protein